MSKSDVIELKGTVKESLPNTQFKVVLDNDSKGREIYNRIRFYCAND